MRVIISIFVLLFPLIVSADEFHTLVRYNCETNQNRLVVEYLGAYNEDGEVLDKSAGKDDWPRPLKEALTGPFMRSCHLSDGIYSYEVKGVPEAQVNLMGRCGAWSSAKVKIAKDEKIIVEQQLDDNCWNPESLVVTKIVVVAGKVTPLITRVQPDDFFSDFGAADQELNHIYQQLMNSSVEVKKKELQKEQRAWLRNRDPKCHKEASNNTGGESMGSISFSACRAISTRERIEELKKWGM